MELEHQLILLKWVLKRFGASSIHELLNVNDSEAVNADGSAFKERLMERLIGGGDDLLTPQMLNDYDTNIIRHTKELNRERKLTGETIIRWCYFQYLALLFTELYLDTYFKQRDELLAALNAEIEAHNAPLERRNRLPALTIDKLNKLAFWMATGSGKTLIFHLHLKQFIHYITKYGARGNFKRILLLTPNEALSAQHIKELTASGIRAVPFQEHGGGDLHTVQVLEITKLKEEQGDKSIAISSLEDKNVLFVDEGHKGLGGKVWLDHRQQLCANGFAFEYSATFKQSINAVATAKTALTQDYATSILFDYSYRHFYNDNYGKDFKAVSLGNNPEDTQEYASELYLTASLLSFYQQMWLYNRHHIALKHFKIERPLWIFVGGSVNVIGADVQKLINFFRRFVSNRAQAIENIEKLLTVGLRNAENRDILQGSLENLARRPQEQGSLENLARRPQELYNEIMRDFFLAPAGGNLHLDNIKGKEAKGEIGLRLGTSDQYFGLINVGDETALLNTLKDEFGDQVQDAEFSDSLFKKLSDDPSCPTSLLIGSRKFTEGWSSWRVSSLGLMGIGQNEGSLIIQLFGRGVRLKGLKTSLRRSAAHEDSAEFKCLGDEEKSALKQLETLNIFALRADYLLTFLSNVGVPPSRRLELTITQRAPLPSYLKLIGVKQAYRNTDLKKLVAEKLAQGDQPLTLKSFEEIATETQRNLNSHRVVVNRYPRIRLAINQAANGQLYETHFSTKHLAFLNTQELLFELDQERREKAYLGLHLDLNEERIKHLLLNKTWYVIKIPPELEKLRKYERLELWQEIALELLKKLMKRIYTSAYQKWEAEHARSYEILSADHPNLLQQYELVIEPHKDDQDQQELQQIFADAEAFVTRYSHSTQPQGPLLNPGSPLTHLTSETHLYNPLIADPRDPAQIEAQEHKIIRVKPTPLNKGELEFVQDLAAYLNTQPQLLNGREVYLLRNQSRGHGVSFFEANNFYPDFILWVVESDEEKTQHILFIDPKGLTHMERNNLKIDFFKTIKGIELKLEDPNIHLHSFIISNTPYEIVRNIWNTQSIEEINELNVIFQEDQKENYIQLMFERALNT